MDRQFLQQVNRGLSDASSRGLVTGLLGAPVDIAASGLGLLGYAHPKPVGGSDWMLEQMLRAGIISPNRNPVAEQVAMSIFAPLGGPAKLPVR